MNDETVKVSVANDLIVNFYFLLCIFADVVCMFDLHRHFRDDMSLFWSLFLSNKISCARDY